MIGLLEFLLTAGLVVVFLLFVAVPSWRDARRVKEERRKAGEPPAAP